MTVNEYEEELDMWISYKIFYQNATTEMLKEHLLAIQKHVSSIIKDYIWHKQHFKLSLNDISGCLEGKTIIGDCMEDEWMIMHLLDEISKMQDSIVKVWDSDGEFLLIEAADHLPRWLSHTNPKNRIFWHNGRLQIIPLPSTSTCQEALPIGDVTLNEALNLIWKRKSDFSASKEIQKAIRSRIDRFPNQIIHHANITVPSKIAYLLKSEPNLIAAAVEAFCHRVPISLRACNAMQTFPVDSVLTTTCKFTRTLYAMLQSQPFFNKTLNVLKEENEKFGMLGMKVAAGFEILATDKLYKSDKDLTDGNFVEFENCLDRMQKYMGNFEFVDYLHMRMKKGIEPVVIERDLKEDDDKWMFVEPEEMDELVNAKLERKDVVDEIVTGVENFMKMESGIEGIDLEDDEPNSESEGEEEEEDEYQVLETILSDPDLMMKMIERNEAMGVDSREMLAKLSKMAQELKECESEEESDKDVYGYDDNSKEDYMDDQDFELLEKLKNDIGKAGDVKVAMNFMEALKSGSGPAANIVRSMGLNVPLMHEEDE